MMASVVALLTFILGPWTLLYDEAASLITFTHNNQQITVAGKFSFESEGNQWKVAPPRDGVGNRLALVDPWDDVQGYITFQQNGDRLTFLVEHRTRQFYPGTLTFDGHIQFRSESFACQTVPKPETRVLQLGAGPADSRKNDSLFAREEDLAFQVLGGTEVTLTSEGNGAYAVKAVCNIQRAEEASISFNVEPNYFKKRYVPYYTPIDRKRCPKPPTGWMSWNKYFDTAGAEENLAEARLGQKYFQPFGMEIWSIESWQGNSDSLPVSKFYNLDLEANETQFPNGMKKLADDIRALGFRPGLWTVPYGTGNQEFYESHKDWFLHDADGKPISSWAGRYTIDPTVPEAVDNIRRIHETAARQWGYEFFKVDGMSGSGCGYMAHCYESPKIRARFRNPYDPNPFEKTVAAIREGIGPDSLFLACQGHFTGPEAAYADAARIGADIVHPNEPVQWENLLNQAGRTLNQVFVNNIVFFTDPDTLLVGDLEMEQARLSATVVALPGQVTFNGDKLAELPPEKIGLIQQTLPPADVHPMNLYPIFEMLPVWNLRIARPFGSWNTVAVFNWDDEPKEMELNFAELGLDPAGDYLIHEFWTGEFFGSVHEKFTVQIPARAVRLLTVVSADQERPQFISSDRHIAQGAVDLRDLSWNAETKTLEGSLDVVGGHKTTLRFAVPAKLKRMGSEPGELVGEYSVETITLESEESGEIPFKLEFEER